MSGHTPGPWSTVTLDGVHTLITAPSRINTRKVEICCVELGYNEPFESEQIANARLIAAAPELLAALQKLVAEFDDLDEHRPLHAGCIQCTEGATPDRYRTGPCPYHVAKAVIAKSGGAGE